MSTLKHPKTAVRTQYVDFLKIDFWIVALVYFVLGYVTAVAHLTFLEDARPEVQSAP